MKRFLIIAAILTTLALGIASAWAACRTQTFLINGTYTVCTTCCYGSVCNTTCN